MIIHCTTRTIFKRWCNFIRLINSKKTVQITRSYIPSIKMKADGVKMCWDYSVYTPEGMKSATSTLIDKARAIYDKVGAVADGEVSIDNVVKPLAGVECILATEGFPIIFAQHSSTSKPLREASTEAQKLISAFDVEMSMRKDIFNKLVLLEEYGHTEKLNAEGKRFVSRLIQLGKRDGLHLSQDIQDQVKEIKTKISNLGIAFQKNLNEENSELLFSEEELLGVPADFLEGLEKDENGKFKVNLSYPHVFPVSRKCKVPNTRKLLDTAFLSRCQEENTPILEEVISLRHEQARLLGYPNHAAYMLELQMAKTPETVDTFMTELAEKLKPLWTKERKIILDMKKAECEELGLDFDGKINPWDMRYYTSMVEEKLYSVDQTVLKPFFPIETVTKGLLDIYQELLSLKFTEIKDVEKWHDDVKMYRVDDQGSNELVGYFFMDLHPREGKYGHACIMKPQEACIDENGKRQVSVLTIMANFSKPTGTKPALLDHDEVAVFFHEFGHVMHGICSKAEYLRFCGSRVERDFVEAPSQMLENWVWNKETLRKMSGHYQDESPIPDEVLDKLVKSRTANAGGFNLRQIALATFDQQVHTTGSADTQKVYQQVYESLTGISPIPGTNMPATFAHMIGGYDARYYGYLWSEVYCMDMFDSRFKKEGLLNQKVGMDYRKMILEPGGSIDGADLLKTFLGREPRMEPFLESKGLA